MFSREPLFSVTKKDLIITTFRSGGPGGQHQNKVETGVRIFHPESGAVGESRTERSQHANKKNALHRLANSQKFQFWIRRKAAELSAGETIEQAVERQMAPEFIRTEVVDPETCEWIKIDNIPSEGRLKCR